ncbi:Retinol dehydrogenase 12 [Schistosoma japonicum]|uniref:Hypotherical protein n=1 Tax=Schistosoma japonicum TaxID=6182 RepID=C1LLA7_SCHJA|nr:Retinol dehydrogenase 12 [Schistosoma japonicum]CAX75485.1 hypotherical protein [Schistosoma japonicum]
MNQLFSFVSTCFVCPYIWVVLVVSVLYFVKKKYFSYCECTLEDRLDGKTVIVTGCNTGIGLETVDELARRGARVIMACRDLEKCKSARLEILTRTHSENPLLCSFRVEPDQLICEELDLESPKSIREFANRIISKEKFVPILINNAGADFPEKIYDEHGIEKHLKVNHLGHFLLTKLLKPCLRTSDGEPCRIIILSSLLHLFAKLTPNSRYLSGTGSGYSISKLLNVIHAREISKRWFVDGIVAVSVHPGLVRTSIFRSVKWKHFLVYYLLRWLTITCREGAQTTVFCALDKNLIPGSFYSECRPRKCNSQALNDEICDHVWRTSEALIEEWESRSQE